MKLSNTTTQHPQQLHPVLIPTRMKAISISRSIFPIFLTVAFMACLLTFSISDGLSSLEQNNPVLLALGNFHHHVDAGPSSISMRSTTATSSTNSASDSTATSIEQSPVVVVEPIPNPEPADGHDTFSACMRKFVRSVEPFVDSFQ
jgi:hypothetical protein